MSEFEAQMLAGVTRLQTQMEQVGEKLEEQAGEIHTLKQQVGELVQLKTEAAASARVLRWIWAVVSFVGGGLIAWLTKDGGK